jgi:hypothetical protein
MLIRPNFTAIGTTVFFGAFELLKYRYPKGLQAL